MTETQTPPEPAVVGTNGSAEAAAWQDAATRLQQRCREIDQAARAAQEAWLTATRERILAPTHTLLENVARVHAGLMREASFDPDPGVGVEVYWHRTRAYRKAVHARVVAPLLAHLAKTNPADLVGQAFQDKLAELARLAEHAPAEEVLPEPPNLFTRELYDGIVVRLRKGGVRARRRLGDFGLKAGNVFRRKNPRKAAPRSYKAPVKLVLDYHMQVRLPRRLKPLHEAYQLNLAQAMADLERALSRWVHTVLTAECDLDRASFYRPPARWSTFLSPPGAPPDAEEEAMGETVAVVQRLQQQEAALHEALTTAAEAFTSLAPAPLDDEVFEGAALILANDLSQTGTFMLDLEDRTLPGAHYRPAALIRDRQSAWSAWHSQVVNRLAIIQHLIVLREQLHALEDALLKRVARSTLEALFDTFRPLMSRLRQVEEQALEACDAAASSNDIEGLRETLENLQSTTLDVLQDTLRDVPGLLSSDQALADPGRPEWEQAQALLPSLPEQLVVHPVPPESIRVVPDLGTIKIELREIVAETLEPPFPEQLKAPAEVLRVFVAKTWGETEQVEQIVQYNLDAAIDELGAALAPAEEPAADEEEPEENPETAAIHAARELAADGLRRAAETLADLAESLQEPWAQFARATFAVFASDWNALHHRVRSDDFSEEQWTGFQIQLRRAAELRQRRLAEWWGRFRGQADKQYKLAQRQAQSLIRKGQSAVGVIEQGEADRLLTLDTLTDLKRLRANLPLVYRKLFSFEPLTEPSLLENRARDLVWVHNHFARWQRGQQAGVLVLSGAPGSGRTSFLNALRPTVLKEADVRVLNLETRLLDVNAVAALLAEVLGIEGAPTLQALEQRLLTAPRPDPPMACLIDNFEHLMLQTAGGTEVIEQVFISLSRTDTRVYWVATMGNLSWHFLEKTAASASGFVTVNKLAPFDRAALEVLILSRHRRSGLPLRFAEPPTSSLMPAQLRRSKTPEERQAVLRQHYFDQLFRHSGQNIMLALFYWLRSADFEAEQGVLTVRSLRPLNFSFLGTFDLTRIFTLRAFLFHHSLTLREHQSIFRMSVDESTLILESLLNLRIIEPYQPTGRLVDNLDYAPISLDDRYRIRSLIVHPLTEYLRGRHIIY